MRAIICESWRDFDALEIKDMPRPALRSRSVRIKVAAAGVSFATQLVVAGKYQRKPPLTFTPGTEIVGTVLEASPDADAPPPGTRVFAVVDWGGMAEEAIADDIHTIAIPDGLPLEPAIGFPISYPTAGAALLWRGKIKSGDWVRLASRAGETTLRASVTDRVAPGVVYTTFHHPLTQANVVTTDYSDWATNCPEYKVTAVQIAPSNGPTQWQEDYMDLQRRSRRIAPAEAAE